MFKFVGDFYVKDSTEVELDFRDDSTLVINLEAPVTDSSKPYSEEKISLKQNFSSISSFFKRKKIIANLSNNHIFDYGKKGVEETIIKLDKANIRYFGMSKHDIQDEYNILEINGQKYLLLAYCCKSSNPIFKDGDYFIKEFSYENVKIDVDSCRKIHGEAIQFIINIHGGLEEVSIPEPDRLAKTRQIACLKPFMIISHHSHVIQPYELYNDVHVFYGLGNFFFPDFEYKHPNGAVSWGVQRRWNDTSIAVNINKDNSITYDLLIRKGCLVKMVSTGINIRKLYSRVFNMVSNTKYYTRYFKIVYKICMLRHALSRFSAKPKVPSFKSIKHIILGR